MTMATKNLSVPANFDDQAEALVARIRAEGWEKKYSIDVRTIEAGLKTHRIAKQKDAELRQAYELHHKGFTIDQAVLYKQYVESLGILRAAHRNQPEVMRSLDGFKRKGGGSRRKKELVSPQPEAPRLPG